MPPLTAWGLSQAISPILILSFRCLGVDLCPAVLVSHMPPPGLGGCLTPDLDVSLPISTSLPACRPASPSLPAPSQFPSDLASALARHSGCPLPAARRTSLARKGRPWPRSGLGGCWQRLCSRQEAEEAGLGLAARPPPAPSQREGAEPASLGPALSRHCTPGVYIVKGVFIHSFRGGHVRWPAEQYGTATWGH